MILNAEVMKRIKQIVFSALKDINMKVDEVILFGSRAREDLEIESDWDILVIIEGVLPSQNKKDVWYAIYKRLHDNFKGYSFDIIVKSKSEFEEEKDILNTISNEAELEGIRL